MSEKKQIFSYLLNEFGILQSDGTEEKKQVEIRKLPAGHINKTYYIHVPMGEYVLQTINRNVYPNSETLMHNLEVITELFQEGTSAIDVPRFLYVNGKNYLELAGECYRMYHYVPESSETSKTPFQIGFVYGSYIRFLNDRELALDSTVEGYHDFDAYYNRLLAATKDHSFETIKMFRSKLDSIFTEDIPKRYIHGDAKEDNVILREDGIYTVLDLDTTMKHYVALDYGDMIRSVTAGVPEENLLDIIRLVTAGFAAGLEGILTKPEGDSLFYGILWVTWELAVRYLTDCYAEERYFSNMTIEQCREKVQQLIAQSEEFSQIKEQIKLIIEAEFIK